MRTRYDPKADDIIDSFDRVLDTKVNLQNKLKKDKKIYIEIGMGKGDFITKMAELDPDNIYIGIELSRQVLSLAIKKLKRYEEENNVKLSIYLNFSDPWPKKRHTKRRLTYKSFLEVYKKVLKKDGLVEFKTDNRQLFEYSLVSMQNFGMTFLEVYLDLHKTDIFNVETEYERKFSPFGPIYKLVAKF